MCLLKAYFGFIHSKIVFPSERVDWHVKRYDKCQYPWCIFVSVFTLGVCKGFVEVFGVNVELTTQRRSIGASLNREFLEKLQRSHPIKQQRKFKCITRSCKLNFRHFAFCIFWLLSSIQADSSQFLTWILYCVVFKDRKDPPVTTFNKRQEEALSYATSSISLSFTLRELTASKAGAPEWFGDIFGKIIHPRSKRARQ